MDKKALEDFDNVIRCINNNPLVISYLEEHRKKQIEVSNITKILFENSFCVSEIVEL